MFYKISHHTVDYNSLSINYLQTLVKKLKNKFHFVTLSIKKGATFRLLPNNQLLKIHICYEQWTSMLIITLENLVFIFVNVLKKLSQHLWLILLKIKWPIAATNFFVQTHLEIYCVFIVYYIPTRMRSDIKFNTPYFRIGWEYFSYYICNARFM